MTDLLARLQAAVGEAYQIERELGGGGMSRLFLATESSLHRKVVIKLLPPEYASEVSETRFRHEIEVAAHLQHINILPVLTAGVSDDLLYYIMPFVPGESLRHRLVRQRRLPVADAITILREIADALAHAHGEGVIHRDIKPENILLLGSHAVLTDFGVARALEHSATGQRLTATGVGIGTPGYMPPEQATGDRNIDERVDVYALAVVGYEMLAGSHPFPGHSSQAIITAQLTAPPPPVRTLRAETPAYVSEAIGGALAKDPQERLRTAAEFRDAVQHERANIVPRIARRVRVGMAAAAIAVVTVLGAFLWPKDKALDRNLIAVAPFDVLAPSLALWHEGLVDVLSRNLDGAGPLRTVSPTIVVRRWSGRADPASAAVLGQKTGARLVVFGTLVSAGRDSVRATVTVYDVASRASIGEIHRHGAVDRMDRLGDSLTVDVLHELGRTRPIASVRLGSLGSSSLPAIKLFLAAEQHYRHGQFDSALASARRAVAIDSGFSLALRRISRVLADGGYGVSYDSAMLLEGRHNHGLAPRESLLVTVDSLWGAVEAGVPEIHPVAQRLARTLTYAIQRYPDDPEIQYMQGELAYHFGDWTVPQLTAHDALDAFDRATALDSAFGPAFKHSPELALLLRGTAAARRYFSAYAGLHPTGRTGMAAALANRLLDPNPARASAARASLDTLPAGTLIEGWWYLHSWPDSAETALLLARAFVRSRRDVSLYDSLAQRRGVLPSALVYRGHLREARAVSLAVFNDGVPAPIAFAQQALLNPLPSDTDRAVFKNCVLKNRVRCVALALAWWATLGDTLSIREAGTYGDSAARSATTITRDLWRYAALAAQPYVALARGDTTSAIQLFDLIPDSLCGGCLGYRLSRVRLLEARGMNREAAILLDRLPYAGFETQGLDGLWGLERGRVNERLGNRDKAIAGYSFVVDVWRHADPELQPLVEEARAGLRRLGVEFVARRN